MFVTLDESMKGLKPNSETTIPGTMLVVRLRESMIGRCRCTFGLEYVPDIAKLLSDVLGSDVCIFKAALAV